MQVSIRIVILGRFRVRILSLDQALRFIRPTVSVVIPAYNAASVILDTVLSVRMQTLTDFELLIIDDGSTDNLGVVLSATLRDDPRVRVIRQANGGLAAARNRGLAEASGSFVGFVDADDLWHPDFLLKLVRALKMKPEAPFAFAYSRRIDEANNVIPTQLWRRPPQHDFVGLLTVNSVGNGSASLFRTSEIRTIGGFDRSMQALGLHGAEDWKLCLSLAARHQPVVVAEPLVCYRLSRSSMSQANPTRQLSAVRAVMADMRASFPATPERHFRDARTMMNGWLWGAFVRKRDWKMLLRLFTQSYILNPLWFRSGALRDVHRMKIFALMQDNAVRQPLHALNENGRQPFAYLNRLTPPPPVPMPLRLIVRQD